MLNTGKTCRAMRDVALYLIDKKKHQILYPFIPSELRQNQFFLLLNAAQGVIVGSCAINMILGTPSYPVNDLNIIVPEGEFSVMDEFITERLLFVSGTSTIHRIFETTVKTFSKYTHHGACITLSEAKDKDIIRVVLKSPSTLDMTFITPGGAATFYPQLTFKFTSCLSDTAKKMAENEKFGSMHVSQFQLEDSTEFLGHSCGSNCPALWRRSSITNEYFAMNWDVRYDVRTLLSNNDIEWRIARQCKNPACDFRAEITSQNHPIPPNRTPATPRDVADQMKNIADHKPVRNIASHQTKQYASVQITDIPTNI